MIAEPIQYHAAPYFSPCCVSSRPTDPCAHRRAPEDEDLARESRRRAAGMLGGLIDAHTHLFPDAFYRALWRWFDANLWEVKFRGSAEQVLEALARAGATRVVALVYAHKPGVARYLNAFLAGLCRAAPWVTGVGTVMPGEPDALDVVREAVDVHGLRGIKLHCHVQRLPVDDPRVVQVLAECVRLGVPAVVHCGRAPASAGYGVDTATICDAERTRRVLRALPRLRIVVPHLGADEYADYLAMLREHEGLYLDTSVSCADYLGQGPDWTELERCADRVMYGSDFPIVPYEGTRELGVLARRVRSDAAFEQIVRGTARVFWGLG